MSFRWHHFLDLAEDLFKQQALPGAAKAGVEVVGDVSTPALAVQTLARSAQEAAYRTCISRAYYASFHIVREYVARGNPELQPKAGSHDWV